MREPYLFSQGKEAEGGVLLTAWLATSENLSTRQPSAAAMP